MSEFDKEIEDFEKSVKAVLTVAEGIKEGLHKADKLKSLEKTIEKREADIVALGDKEGQAKRIVDEANEQAIELIEDAKKRSDELVSEATNKAARLETDVLNKTKRLEDTLVRLNDQVEEKKKELEAAQKRVDAKNQEIAKINEKARSLISA